MRKIQILALLFLFSFIPAVAKPPAYVTDKFTGNETLSQTIYFTCMENTTYGSDQFHLNLAHTKGHALLAIINADLSGPSSQVSRFDEQGNHIGQSELLILADDSKLSIPVIKAIALKDQQSSSFAAATIYGITVGGSSPVRTQNIDFYLELTPELLTRISNAKKVEGSFREYLPTGSLHHILYFRSVDLKNISTFLKTMQI